MLSVVVALVVYSDQRAEVGRDAALAARLDANAVANLDLRDREPGALEGGVACGEERRAAARLLASLLPESDFAFLVAKLISVVVEPLLPRGFALVAAADLAAVARHKRRAAFWACAVVDH